MPNKYNIKDKKIAQVPKWSLRFALWSVFLVAAVPILLILITLLPALYIPEYKSFLRDNFSVTHVLVLCVAYYALFVAYMVVKLRRRAHVLSELGLRSFPIGTTIKYIALYPIVYFSIVIVMVTIIVAVANQLGFPLTPDDIAPKQDKRSFGWIYVILGVLIAPILEEIIFRGILLPAFARRSGWFKGSIYSSMIFSILHGPAAPLIMIFSLYLSRMYYRTGSIIPGILLHMANNAFVILVILR